MDRLTPFDPDFDAGFAPAVGSRDLFDTMSKQVEGLCDDLELDAELIDLDY